MFFFCFINVDVISRYEKITLIVYMFILIVYNTYLLWHFNLAEQISCFRSKSKINSHTLVLCNGFDIMTFQIMTRLLHFYTKLHFLRTDKNVCPNIHYVHTST